MATSDHQVAPDNGTPTQQRKRVAAGGIVGNVLEWYDFSLYGYLAPITAPLFFPSEDSFTSLVQAFAVFAVGFVARPIGGIIYGHIGDEPTVTDAAVVLGLIDPEFFLGGSITLDTALARHAVKRHVAGPLGVPVDEAALAIFALTNETMASAIEAITVNQGVDPRDAVLIGGGGAAGLNSVAIARRLGCRCVIFPDTGAALSATGGLLSPLSDDFSTFFPVRSSAFDKVSVNAGLKRLTTLAEGFAAKAGANANPRIDYSVEARYAQQIWEIKVPLLVSSFRKDDDVVDLCNAFHALHREIFAFDDPLGEIEFINWRATVACDLRDQPVGHLDGAEGAGAGVHERTVVFPGPNVLTVPIHRFEALDVDDDQGGPAIVETPYTTIVIDPGTRFQRTESGSLVVLID